MDTRSVKLVKVAESLLIGNHLAADRNRERLRVAEVLGINIMSSPGAGKTSLIVRTLEAVRGRTRIGVIEGDIAGSIDAEKVIAAGAVDAVQINTGGNCHLEANMVDRALDGLDLTQLDVLFVENVGNLVCPTHWALGEHLKVCLSSTAERHDKPMKCPEMFAVCDAIVLHKIDLIELVDSDRAVFYESVRALNPGAPIREVSCRTGDGLTEWADWLLSRRAIV